MITAEQITEGAFAFIARRPHYFSNPPAALRLIAEQAERWEASGADPATLANHFTTRKDGTFSLSFLNQLMRKANQANK